MKRSLVVFLLIFLVSCATKKQVAEFEALPDWVKQKPILPGYYVGIASVKKVGTTAQYTAKARRQALADLAESVSSTVSSTSVLHAIETQYGFSETFNQKIEITTSDYLEGFEPVDAYDTEDSYWVYYKIDKRTYHEMKEKKKQEAIAAALSKYQSGTEQDQKNNPKEAIAFYLQGLQALKQYLNEDNPAIYNNQPIDIGNELFSSINKLLNNLKIGAERSGVIVKRRESFKDQLEFLITYRGQPVHGIPVSFSFSGGYLKTDQQVSGESGKVSLEPFSVYSKNKDEQITAAIDLKTLAQQSVDDLFIRGIIQQHDIQPAIVDIKIMDPTIALHLGKNSYSNNQYNKVTTLFVQNADQFGFSTLSESNTDYLLEMDIHYQPGERAGGLVSVYLSAQLMLKNQRGQTIWSKQTENIKGVGYSNDEARNISFEEFRNYYCKA